MESKWCLITAAIICAMLTTALALADETSEKKLEEVIVVGELSLYSATKSNTPIMETARSISIESLQQIIDKGALTLDDTFTYTAGVIGETYGYATRGDWVKVRGLNIPQYQDSLQSLFGNYNNTRPDIYTLEQIEILKGPASVLYGQGSPGGIVNVVSKRPQRDSQHELLLEGGTFSRKQVGVDSTGSLASEGQWLYRLVALYRDSDTQVDFVEDKTTVFAPSITWHPTNYSNITLLINHTDTQSDTAAQFLPIWGTLKPAANGKHLDSGVYVGEPEFNQYDAKTTAATLWADHQISDAWRVEFTSRYTDAKADYQQAWLSLGQSANADGLRPRTFYRSNATSKQVAADMRFHVNFATASWEHEVLIGVQYQDVTIDNEGFYAAALGAVEPLLQLGSRYWLDPFNPVYGNIPSMEILNLFRYRNPDSTTEDLGFYLSDQISIDQWRVTLGVRFDETETDNNIVIQKDDAVSVSVGVLYQFDNGLSPYLNYSESFEPVIASSPDARVPHPQEGQQVEVGFKYQITQIPAMLTVSYFDIKQTNLSDPNSPVNVFDQQRGQATVKGLEVEGIASLGDITIELNISQLDTQSAEGYPLASVPEKQASSWITYRPQDLWRGFKAGAGIRFVGESYGGRDIVRTPSFTLIDLMLGYEMNSWDFAVNVRNLTDKHYYATCSVRGDCFPGDERTMVGRIRYRF